MPLRAERLKQLRKLRGYTQQDLAKALHIAQQQVTRWESGANDPSADTLERIAKVLECTADWLLGLVDEPTQRLQARELTPDEEQLLDLYRQRKLPQMITRLVNELARTNAQEDLVVNSRSEATISGEEESFDG